MGDIVFYSLAIFFSSFGIISFCIFITDFFYETKYLKDKDIYTVFFSKDEICTIENIARAIIFKTHKICSGMCNHRVIAIDKHSTDGTYGILKRMEKCEGKIVVLREKDMENLIKKYNTEDT